mgnify:CR=1 FL=1
MPVQHDKNPARATLSADTLLLAVTVAVIAALLWLGWGEAAEGKPLSPLRPVAWDNDRLLPKPITSLSPLYQVFDRNERLSVGVEGKKAGTALLVWLEGEWVVMAWDETDTGVRAHFDGWLPAYVTVAGVPAATARRGP